MELVNDLIELNIVQHGEFTLKSGQKSNIYVDFRKVMGYPTLLEKLSYNLSQLITGNPKSITGIPFGGIPYASNISRIKNIPMIYVRDEEKTYGNCNLIEGIIHDEVIIIEDVLTTGSSIQKYVEVLQKNNIKVIGIYVILNRSDKFTSSFAGIPLKYLYTLNDFYVMPRLESSNPIINIFNNLKEIKKSNLILSLDTPNPHDFFIIANRIAPYVVGIKVHCDIMNFDNYDFDYDRFKLNILRLKTNHNILIIEDRKYSDIGSIVQKQAINISDWADIVTVHSLTGLEMLKALDSLNIPMIVVYQLSTKDNLIDNLYSYKTSLFSYELKNVIGYVTQEEVKTGPKLLHFTPGVSLELVNDTMGQTYKGKNSFSDFYIVGRSIYEAENVEEAVEKYRIALKN